MNVKNLAIGDFVEDVDSGIGEVVAIRFDGGEHTVVLALIDDVTEPFSHVSPEGLVPISLTPEILEKNGFKSWEHGYMWKERIGMGGQTTSATSPIEIIIYEGGHSVIMNPHDGKEFQGSIDNVHDLQHALRMCGIGKEITL